MLVRLPRAAAARRSIAADVRVPVDVDVDVAAAAVTIAAPRRAHSCTPNDAGGKSGTRRIRVVVRRIRSRVVNGRCALDNDRRRVVLRHIDDLWVGRLHVDDFLLDLDHLLLVGLEAACRLCLAAKSLDSIDHIALTGDHRLAKRGRPFEIPAHHLDDLGIIQQRLHRVVPLVIDRQLWIGLALFQPAIRLHELKRIRRSGQDERHQIVRIQRDWPDKLLELRRGNLRRGSCRSSRRLRDDVRCKHQQGNCPQEFHPRGRSVAALGSNGTAIIDHACSGFGLAQHDAVTNRLASSWSTCASTLSAHFQTPS